MKQGYAWFLRTQAVVSARGGGVPRIATSRENRPSRPAFSHQQKGVAAGVRIEYSGRRKAPVVHCSDYSHKRYLQEERMNIMAERPIMATRSRLTACAFLAVLFLSSCAPVSTVTTPAGKEQEKMLVGRVTKEQLFREFPAFRENAARYKPEQTAVEKLREVTRKTEVLLFLGTWCSDSISEAPKTIKIFETVNSPNFSLQLYGVDRAKEDGLGFAGKFNVKRVPTVIFLQDDKELGRIVEYPNETMEDDTLAILTPGK
jgi:thiol-disulfide isomerase/thioredoxin